MKKYIVSVILVSAMLIGVTGNVYGYYSQEGWESSAIKQLEKLDIVRDANRWNKTDYITRRDAFKIAFIIKEYRRDYYYNKSRVEGKYDWFEAYLNNCEIARHYGRKFDFADIVTDSDDYYLMANLFMTGLSAGKEEGGELYAELDDPLTYNEAFATIMRMTMLYSDVEKLILSFSDKSAETVYYEFAKEMKLFSGGTIYDKYYYEYAPKVEVEQLNEPIRAYEYLYYVYRGLYIPCAPLGDYAPEPINYRINYFEGNEIPGEDITI